MHSIYKMKYITPTAETVDIQMQQVICLSQTTTPKFGEDWTWDE